MPASESNKNHYYLHSLPLQQFPYWFRQECGVGIMGSMTSDKLSLCKTALCFKHLSLIGLTTSELKKRRLKTWCVYILECTLRWASLDSSWVWVTNSDPMYHQRFLYFSSLFSSSQVYLLLNHVHAIQWLSHYNEVSGEQLTHLHCSQQPWEITIINNDAPNYINTMLSPPGKI